MVPDATTGGFIRGRAQHAIREAPHALARNVLAALDGRAGKPFRSRRSGSSPHRTADRGGERLRASLLGFAAWWLWRTIYLSKLPRFEKKLRVALDWTLDLAFAKDLRVVQGAERPVEIPVTAPTAAAAVA